MEQNRISQLRYVFLRMSDQLVCASPTHISGMMEILPDRCTMIAKKELVYAGTVGIVCWLGGIVFINRKKTSDAKSVMDQAAQTMLDQKVPLSIRLLRLLHFSPHF